MKDKNEIPTKVKIRKHLNADALFKTVRRCFEKIPDHRQGDVKISLADAHMSAFAMFSLKDPSLLAFDERRQKEHNLNSIYGIERVPCDTQMRTLLDDQDPEWLRPSFKEIFLQLQRGKALEQMVFMEGCYLLNLDGTGYYSSEKIGSESCLKKVNKKTGKVTYYQQMLGAAIVHPDFKEVIPLAPEMIIKQDGETKNDCERNAAKRFFEKLRKDHPRLKLIVNEDALNPNAPHIRDLNNYGLHYILSVKEGDHAFLFDYVEKARKKGQTVEYEYVDENTTERKHLFHFINGVPLNRSNPDLRVNFVEYGEVKAEKIIKYFSWITDFTITKENVYKIMRGGRARWKIENETFNTLKNQGYNLEHNYGLGKKHLSSVFANLMMLAFLVDQTQQLACNFFRAVWKNLGSKRALWERMRSLFQDFELESMEMLYSALIYGIKFQPPIILYDTS
jgi:hypothetical protein